MLDYIYHVLENFRSCFTRKRAWLLFCLVILGFMGGTLVEGVTSFCRIFGLHHAGYLALLHFFRSTAWDLDSLLLCWSLWLLKSKHVIYVGERVILIGDHTKCLKDGRRMPGVVSLHDDSETQSKPQHFRGHQWAAVGILTGKMEQSFCTPLRFELDQGRVHITPQNEDNSNEQKGSSITRMATVAKNWATEHKQPCFFVLDSFFAVAPTFRVVQKLPSPVENIPLVTVITRAKSNCVGYRFPEPKPPGKRGRPALYGESVKLKDVFDNKASFQQADIPIYGQLQTVRYRAERLLWKGLGEHSPLLFIWLESRHGRVVLMTNDLSLDPLLAIQLYGLRVRIETMFSALKGWLGAFCYHFWSKGLDKHSRRPKPNSTLQPPATEQLHVVRQVWECYQRFVNVAAIALGLLQLVALQYPNQVWQHFQGFLRTRSRDIPSERTVILAVAPLLHSNFRDVAPHAIMQEIRNTYVPLRSPVLHDFAPHPDNDS